MRIRSLLQNGQSQGRRLRKTATCKAAEPEICLSILYVLGTFKRENKRLSQVSVRIIWKRLVQVKIIFHIYTFFQDSLVQQHIPPTKPSSFPFFFSPIISALMRRRARFQSLIRPTPLYSDPWVRMATGLAAPGPHPCPPPQVMRAHRSVRRPWIQRLGSAAGRCLWWRHIASDDVTGRMAAALTVTAPWSCKWVGKEWPYKTPMLMPFCFGELCWIILQLTETWSKANSYEKNQICLTFIASGEKLKSKPCVGHGYIKIIIIVSSYLSATKMNSRMFPDGRTRNTHNLYPLRSSHLCLQ